MARQMETTRPGPSAVLLADRREGPDLWDVTQAMRPLADLCLSGEAETPFALGLVGPRGAGKSFALRRLLEAIEARARAARPPLLSKLVIAEVDAAGHSGDPASAVAAAAYAALERDYSALAEEVSQGAVDPRHAAAAAVERHDEIVARLEQERRARDEAEARRARLREALLFETPGSRIDAFIRASRGSIEAKLRRFGFEGDSDAGYRNLVRDLSGQRVRSRVGLFLRSLWAYRGQTRLVVLAIVAFALAYGVSWLREPAVQDRLPALAAQAAAPLDWIRSHDETLEYVTEALIVAGVAALLINLWRAASFTGLMFRGLRMLNLDVRERRRELDASAARLERRVASLQMEADAAQARAEALARRAGGAGAPTNRGPGPAFLAPTEAPERVARAFLAELGRAMDAAATAAPQRLVIAVDGTDALPPDEARRFLEAAVRIAGRGVAVVATADLGRLNGDPRDIAESLFEVVYDVGAGTADTTLAGRLLAPSTPTPAPVEPPRAELGGPLDETEIGFLKTASALVGPRPRALKRLYNAYRLARIGDAPRGALALSLAALMAPDPTAASSLRWTLSGEGELTAPAGPSELKTAFEGLGVQGMGKAAARSAFEAARRFAPWG